MLNNPKPEYLMFKLKKERAESLMHSYNYNANIAKAAGYSFTGMLPKFFEQMHEMLYRKERKPFDGTKRD